MVNAFTSQLYAQPVHKPLDCEQPSNDVQTTSRPLDNELRRDESGYSAFSDNTSQRSTVAQLVDCVEMATAVGTVLLENPSAAVAGMSNLGLSDAARTVLYTHQRDISIGTADALTLLGAQLYVSRCDTVHVLGGEFASRVTETYAQK